MTFPRHLQHGKKLLLLILLAVLGYQFYFCLPDTLFNQTSSRIILDRNNNLLGAHIAQDEQWRFPPSVKIPEKFTSALIAYEDKRFNSHIGVDFLALLRATWLNLRHGHIVSGGSTLSMQVIRMSRKKSKRTFWQKIVEIFITLRLETRYTKKEILALHANHAPFGGNVVGLEAASWRYFGRSPEHLSWAESATLAVLPNSPSLIHLGRQREKLKLKRNALLEKLHHQGQLSRLDYDLALTEAIPNKPKPLPRFTPHLLDTLSKQHPEQHRFQTTIDRALQQKINQTATHYAARLKLSGIHNLSILVIDNRTLQVVVYIGNSSNKQTGIHGEAIDLVQRPRSTGSTLKPFLFAAMIQSGDITPETLIADVPVRYAGFVPKNYDRSYHGAVPAKQALARSLNIPAANMLSLYGVERFQSLLKQMGMTTLHRNPRNYGLTLILGGAEGTLWDLTALYANLAYRASQDRKQRRRSWVKPVVLQEGDINTQQPATISPPSAWMTLQALLEVTRPENEGYWKKFASSRKIAWKTGTSFGHRDAWSLGVTSDYTVGVWAGNASGEGQAELTGTTTAAPILFDVFNHLPAQQEWFKRPDKQMKKIQICIDDGFLASALCKSKQLLMPDDSHFDRISPYHKTLHLDLNQQWQVHSGCEQMTNISHQPWFILPPDQAFYYQQYSAHYKKPPPFRQDCLSELGNGEKNIHKPIALIYPRAGTSIYIPKELDGTSGKTIFRALHEQENSLIYWHLDNTYIGKTRVFHQQAFAIKAGKHILTLIDENGSKIEQKFTVLSK